MTVTEGTRTRAAYLTEKEFGNLVNHGGVVFDKNNQRIRGASIDDKDYINVSVKRQFSNKYLPIGKCELEQENEWFYLVEKVEE